MKRILRFLVMALSCALAFVPLSPSAFAKSLSDAQIGAATVNNVTAWNMKPADFVSAYNDFAQDSAVEIGKYNKNADSTIKFDRVSLGIFVAKKGNVSKIQASLPIQDNANTDAFRECVTNILLTFMQGDTDAVLAVFSGLGVDDNDSLTSGYAQSSTHNGTLYRYANADAKLVFTVTPKASGSATSSSSSSATAKASSGQPKSDAVYVTQSGKSYHRSACASTKNSKNLTTMTTSEAKSKGYTACKVCKP